MDYLQTLKDEYTESRKTKSILEFCESYGVSIGCLAKILSGNMPIPVHVIRIMAAEAAEAENESARWENMSCTVTGSPSAI